jgi:hypothetical protein
LLKSKRWPCEMNGKQTEKGTHNHSYEN